MHSYYSQRHFQNDVDNRQGGKSSLPSMLARYIPLELIDVASGQCHQNSIKYNLLVNFNHVFYKSHIMSVPRITSTLVNVMIII